VSALLSFPDDPAIAKVNCRKQAWVLKNSLSLQNDRIWGIENVSENRERRFIRHPDAILFCEFLGREFFNSHRQFHQLSASGTLLVRTRFFANCTLWPRGRTFPQVKTAHRAALGGCGLRDRQGSTSRFILEDVWQFRRNRRRRDMGVGIHTRLHGARTQSEDYAKGICIRARNRKIDQFCRSESKRTYCHDIPTRL
jgi:hypothetical protein